ncbi:MAG: DegT/DnrJ/EryC1/StrS family aminotransferase, partial [Candidatus Omnitrophica bacterium]|nr:DegT/DnrJ/EryC1/StrS family aminotransferase [Candidatus Omnitrophota bacterium]
ESVVTGKTRAIMAVHLMGKPADMDAIRAIAKKHDLKVIEDAAEAHGAQFKGEKIGSIGDVACFSLYAAHIVTSIEGGMVITDDPKIAHAVRSLRNHGIEGKFTARRIGFSSKMNELEAAVGVGNIKIFQKIFDKRRANLLHLIEGFKPFEEYFYSIREDAGEVIGPHAFSIIVKEGMPFTKDDLVQYYDEQGVDSRNLFYSIPTQCPSYAFLGHGLGDYPEAEYCSNHGTHIGIHQDVGIAEMDYILEVTEQFLKKW